MPRSALITNSDEDPELAHLQGDVVEPDAARTIQRAIDSGHQDLAGLDLGLYLPPTVVRVAPSTHIHN